LHAFCMCCFIDEMACCEACLKHSLPRKLLKICRLCEKTKVLPVKTGHPLTYTLSKHHTHLVTVVDRKLWPSQSFRPWTI